jgi:O-acetylserine/cysteine efflux transporter
MDRGDRTERLPATAIGAAALIAAVWGFNFVVIKIGVSAVPPLMLAALRFLFCVLPAIFFVRRPAAPMGRIAAYGLFLGVGEFGFLFTAIKLGAPSGLSSILLQAQAFFTAILASVFLGERLKARSAIGMAVAAAGLALFAFAPGGSHGGSPVGGTSGLTPLLLGMILLAALGWAFANVEARRMPGVNALGLMVWSSLFSPLPLAALSLAFEGKEALAASFSSIGWLTVGALAYLVLLSTLLGYGLWNGLIMRYGASRIAPFSLMVPVFGLASASLVLGESFGPRDALGAALILAGLLVHALNGRGAASSGHRTRRASGGSATP